ncbi:hypothetical protein [Acrocarpospora macrocephala]|uniref:hypothetical protein n=1 Tax=Acrocarpospora macrocephala TaxID=150177 RepID=UPI0012D33C62|nr:hypothetical protein [Acrocarpospora macrocephala]
MNVRTESNSQLTDEQQRVYRVRHTLERDGGTPAGLLSGLASVVADGTWKQVPKGKNTEEPFTSFKEFVEAKPPYGLGYPAAHLLQILHIPHPHEGNPRMRAEMDSMRAEVRRLLAEDGVTGYTEDQRDRDIQAWAALDQAGGWWLGFFIACQVESGQRNVGGKRDATPPDRNTARPTKVSASEFARRAGTTSKRVLRYYRAWEAAAEAGAVGLGTGQLYPGHPPIDFPPAEDWSLYFGGRATGTSHDRQQAISDQALAQGIKPTMALVIAENPTALRAAILADPKTAQQAKGALTALALEARKADQVEYIRKAAQDGNAKTPAGQVIELPNNTKAQAAEHLAVIESPETDHDAIKTAYESVQALVAVAIWADPEIQTREQRTKFHKTLSNTTKNLESIHPDDLIAVADDDLREQIANLQKQVNELASLIMGS